MSEGYRFCLTGVIFSAILTLIPFWMVMSGIPVSRSLVLSVIFGFGAIQILVHLRYFLHVTLKEEEGWKVFSLVFVLVLLVIILSGSLWIMFHLEKNMMPAHELIEQVRNLP